jgi:hypothetical protein
MSKIENVVAFPIEAPPGTRRKDNDGLHKRRDLAYARES